MRNEFWEGKSLWSTSQKNEAIPGENTDLAKKGTIVRKRLGRGRENPQAEGDYPGRQPKNRLNAFVQSRLLGRSALIPLWMRNEQLGSAKDILMHGVVK